MSSDLQYVYSGEECETKYANIWFNDKIFLQKFIKCYREERGLWDCDSPYYKDKQRRRQGINKMLQIMRTVKPDASPADVKRKINTLRSSYRRELNKVLKSTEAAPYRTTLWYYKLLHFLRADIGRHERVLGTKHDDEDDTCCSPSSSQPTRRQVTPVTPTEVMNNQREVSLRSMKKLGAAKGTEYNEDTLHTTAMIWATKLRSMTPMQRILAEKAMNEVVFQGELGALTLKGVQNISMMVTVGEKEPDPIEEHLEEFETYEFVE